MLLRRTMTCLLIVLMLGSFVMVGCANNLTKANYEKLKIGMDFEKVAAILGSQTECSEALGTKSCTWGSDAKYIKVKFVADKVIFFSNKGIQ